MLLIGKWMCTAGCCRTYVNARNWINADGAIENCHTICICLSCSDDVALTSIAIAALSGWHRRLFSLYIIEFSFEYSTRSVNGSTKSVDLFTSVVRTKFFISIDLDYVFEPKITGSAAIDQIKCGVWTRYTVDRLLNYLYLNHNLFSLVFIKQTSLKYQPKIMV